ncbi:MAG: cytosine permease [Microbacterium sp.]|uniref:purine-cytosine permease family protein n=1 Tax=Microbacterium sp. TaxID=51671 RepID=UPI0039E3E29A
MPSSESRESDTFVDTASHLETRGIETIRESDRHGRARDLFAVWAAPNVSVLNFTIGATLTIVLGLEVWQALLVILVSSVLWILPGIVATSGPAAGTSGSVIQRAIYGIHGNRVVIAFYGWLVSGVFLALNWVASSFMGAELLMRWGMTDHTLALILVSIVVSAITVLVAVYGHALILRAYSLITVVLVVIFLAVMVVVAPQLDWGFQQPFPLEGVSLWSSVTIAFALLASTPLSYSNSADFARYLPKTTKPAAVVAATALGGAIPCFFFTGFGALLGSIVSFDTMQETGIETVLLDMLPGWLGALFVFGVIVNTIALNGMTTYTASMALQSIGVPIKRIPSAILIGVLGTAFTIFLVLSTGLLDAVNLMLQFLLIISLPTITVYVVDILLRRNRYDALELFDEGRGSIYWYHGGFGLAGLASVVVGGTATALFLSTEVWTGPFAAALGDMSLEIPAGIDLSVPFGMLVSAAMYALLAGRRVRRGARAA